MNPLQEPSSFTAFFQKIELWALILPGILATLSYSLWKTQKILSLVFFCGCITSFAGFLLSLGVYTINKNEAYLKLKTGDVEFVAVPAGIYTSDSINKVSLYKKTQVSFSTKGKQILVSWMAPLQETTSVVMEVPYWRGFLESIPVEDINNEALSKLVLTVEKERPKLNLTLTVQ